MSCSNSPATCRCSQHHLGLAAFAPDLGAYLEALNRTVDFGPRRLAVVDVPKTENVYMGDRPQPWDVKPPRHLRAA